MAINANRQIFVKSIHSIVSHFVTPYCIAHAILLVFFHQFWSKYRCLLPMNHIQWTVLIVCVICSNVNVKWKKLCSHLCFRTCLWVYVCVLVNTKVNQIRREKSQQKQHCDLPSQKYKGGFSSCVFVTVCGTFSINSFSSFFVLLISFHSIQATFWLVRERDNLLRCFFYAMIVIALCHVIVVLFSLFVQCAQCRPNNLCQLSLSISIQCLTLTNNEKNTQN